MQIVNLVMGSHKIVISVLRLNFFSFVSCLQEMHYLWPVGELFCFFRFASERLSSSWHLGTADSHEDTNGTPSDIIEQTNFENYIFFFFNSHKKFN